MQPRVFKWVVVAALFVVSAINYADRTAITALFPLLRTDLGFSDVGLAAIGSVFLWSYALASPLSGYIGDRSSRSRVIVWSLAGWSAATLITGLVDAQWQLLAMRVALGLTEAMYLPAALALVTEYHEEESRGTALGIVQIGNYIGLVGGGTLAGWLGESFGWRAPLVVLGGFGIVIAAGLSILLPRKSPAKLKPAKPAPPQSFFSTGVGLFRTPSIAVVAAAGMLSSIGTWIFINWLPLYFSETFHLSLASAGFFGSSLVSLTAALSAAAGGPISDVAARKGSHRRMLVNAVLIACAAPTLLAFLVKPTQNTVMIALVLYSIFRSIGDINIVPMLCELAGENRRSTAIGVTNMLNATAGGCGVLIAGALKGGFGLSGVFGGVAAILALDAAILFIGYFFFVRKDLARLTPTA